MTATVGRPSRTDSTTSRCPGRKPGRPKVSRRTDSRSIRGPWHVAVTPAVSDPSARSGSMLPESFVVVRDDAVARFQCLTGQGACHPPIGFDETAGLLPGDFRRFYVCRADGGPFSWARFADVLNDELIVPLDR